MLLKRWNWPSLRRDDDLLKALNRRLRDLENLLNHPGYRFRANPTADDVLTSGVWTTPSSWAADFNIGNVFDPSTGQVTIPADGAGPWFFEATGVFAVNTVGIREIQILRDGAAAPAWRVQDPEATWTVITVSTLQEVDAGMTFELQLRHTVGSDLSMSAAGSHFVGTRLLGRIPG